ncbi:MAG: sigma-70 family RNA polymerase sigma factor [Phycisphaerales bacterium]
MELKPGSANGIGPPPTSPAHPRRRSKHRNRAAYRVIQLAEDSVHYPTTDRLPYLMQSRLIQRAQAGDTTARNTVWIHNARLVYSVLGRFGVQDHIVADALQAGQLGVLRAIERFDVERYLAFSTYASHWIRSRVRVSETKDSFSTRIPSYLWPDLIRFHRHVAQAGSADAWFDARDAWLADDRKTYSLMLGLHAVACPVSLDRSAHDLPAAEPGPLDRLIAHEERGELLRQLEKLPDRDATILLHRFRDTLAYDSALQRIGERVGLTRERVRQLIAEALVLLHARLARRGMVDDHEDRVSSRSGRSAAPREPATTAQSHDRMTTDPICP